MPIAKPSSQQEWTDAISPSLLFLILIIIAFVALLVYGKWWNRRFEARVPLTTMNQVELAVGKGWRC